MCCVWKALEPTTPTCHGILEPFSLTLVWFVLLFSVRFIYMSDAHSHSDTKKNEMWYVYVYILTSFRECVLMKMLVWFIPNIDHCECHLEIVKDMCAYTLCAWVYVCVHDMTRVSFIIKMGILKYLNLNKHKHCLFYVCV